MAFVPLTDEEKRILQNGGGGETEPPETSAGGVFGGINVSSVPQVASARDRLADLRTEAADAEADINPVVDHGLLNRNGAFTRMPTDEPPFQGEERLNPVAPGSGTIVELSPEERAAVAKEAPLAESTRFLAERFREAYSFGDPDAYAEDVKRASATGIPFHMVYNDNEMRQAADWQRSLERNLDGLSKLPPALVNWLRIPGRMELARDDIGTLAQLGELLRVEEYRKNTWNITQGYRGGTATMEMGDIGTKAIFGQATEADLKRMEELRESLAMNDRTKGTTGEKLVSGLGYMTGLRQEQFRAMADQALLYGAAGAGLAGLFGQAGPQVALPEELITVPAGFLFGARYGAALGALTKGFAMEAGNAYWEFKEIRDEEGNFLPEELIRVGAILYGIGASGLEWLQAGRLAKVVPGMGRLLTREGISTLLKTPTFRDAVMKFFKEYSGDLTFEVLIEGAQKGWQLVVGEFLKNEQNVRELGDALGVNSDDMYGWMQQAGGIVPDPEKLGFTGERGTFEPTTFAAAMDDVWKEVSEAIYSFALGLVPGAGINFLSNTLAVSRARDMQGRFATLAGLTQESRLAQRFPPAWREAVSALTKDGPVAEVGIDANVFYDTLNQEGLNPTEVARQLGVKAEDLDEARKNKTDIWVETGAYAEHVAGTKLHNRLKQDIRVGGPEELTLREAQAREIELRGQFNEAVEEASRALEASGADRAQLEEIQANVREQLLSLQAKWMKPNVAEGYATLWAHMAQQAAKRWGITPREWAERISLKIVDGEDGTKRLTASYDQQAGRFSATMDRDLLERAEQMWASGQDADGKIVALSMVEPAMYAPGTVEIVPVTGLILVHGSENPNMTLDGIEIVRTSGQKQGKKGRVYGGFYAHAQSDIGYADTYARMKPGTPTIYDIQIRSGTKILHKEGDVTRLSEKDIERWKSQGIGVVVGKDPRGRIEYAVIDKGAILNFSARGRQDGNAALSASLKQPVDQSVNVDEKVPVLDISDAMGAAEDQDLTDATLVVNPGTEYELSIPWRGADPVRHDAGIADAVAAAIMDHEQGEANPDNILLPPDGQTLFQVQNLEEYGGTWEPQIRTWMEQNGFSEAQIHERLGAIRGQMAIFSALGPVQLELLPQGAGLNRGKGKGPIRKNSDLIYKITFDASAMCPKRLSAAATAFEVQKRIGRALTASERMALVALYKAAGKAAPCIYCYVEAPRGKSSEFVKVATDVVIGKTEPKKSWSKSSTDLAKLARTEYETLGMTPADIDPNVILDFEYAETAEARSKVEAAPAIYAFLLAQMLAAKANLPKLYEEYSGQILDLPDDLLKELNTYAGLRFFSSSDFQEAHIADLMQAFVDMSLRGATSHAYTKILEYVRIFGKTRQKIQTSIFAKEVDGQIVMDDWQGMDWAEAKKFRKEFPDVGTVLVGASDNIVAWALQQDWIDYIIPFHYSGLEKKYYSAMGWQDFTSTQREISIDDPKQGDHGIRMHETGSAAGITNAQGTRNYLKLAMERRLYPVFPAFIFKDGMEPVLGKNGKPLKDQRKAQTDRAKARWKEMVDKGKIDWKQINLNYYKLRKDYARTDTPFLPVQAEFDMGEAQAAFERFLNGEAPGAKIETGIADDLVRLIREHGEGVGEWALTEVNMGRPLGPSSMGWQGAGERSAAPTGMDILAQAISSANTSLRQVAATFKNKYFTPGDRNLDIGGGRFDYGTRFLGEKGVENLVFDPYNRSPEHNRAIIERLRGGERFPTVTVNNVLNVIAEQDVRENVVLQAAKSLEDGGTAYFLIHEGDGGGQGRKTSKGWQNNRKADLYTEEVGKHFSDVQRKGNLILAKSPVNIEGPAAWDASQDTADRTFFQDSIDTDYLAAVEAGDMETAQKLVLEAARAAGYLSDSDYRMQHRAPNSKDDVNLVTLRESGLVPEDYWTKPEWYQHAKSEWASWRTVTAAMRKMDAAISRGEDPGAVTIMMYRAVPKTVSEASFRNGDWVTPSRADAVNEGQMIPEGYRIISRAVPAKNLYWDGNSINEWGYDDGQGYGYQNTPNNRKLLDAVTRDDAGNVIPLSQRFDTGTPDIRYQKRGRKQQPRGSITLQREWGAQEETVLTLTPNADKSTFLHEIGHLFLWDLEQLEKSGLADEKTLEDLEALRAWWSDHVSDLAIWIRKQKSFPQELRDRLTGPGWEQRIQEAIRGRGDADVVKAVQVATQEYWARGIEAYLMEGVAPNSQLERLFAQFRTWLTGIYRALQGVPDVQLSDEVRAVMDRMVASEDAIEMARLKRDSDKAARAMLAEGVADREAEQYRAAAEQAAARAKTRLLKVLMGELQEDHKKKIETARADAEKRILPELLRLPHYRVYDRLRQWTHETGEWLSSAGLTEDQMDMVPEGLMTPEGGIDREVAADLLGLESEAELMALLAEARMRPLDQVLAEMVDAEVAPLESAMNNPELLQEQAEEALMGADRIRLLSLEREILQKKISKIEGITTQDSRTMAARAAGMTEQARDMFRGRTMRDAGAAARYMAEARRAGRQAFEAALAGRLEDALEAKDREMLFSALYLESKKLQEEREKNLRYLRKFWTGRQRLKPLVGEENLAQIQRILERYGFQQELPVEGRVPLGKWLGAANAQLGADLEETGVGIPVPDWMVAEDYRDEFRSWKDLTVEEFGELHKAVKAIEHFGRTQGRLVAQEKQQNLQTWKDKLQANVVKVWGKLKPGSIDPNYEGAPSVSRFLAAHDRIEFLLRRLDGFEDLGPAWQLLFQPVVTAERSEIARMRSAKAAIESIFSSYTAEERAEMRKKKYTTAQLDPQTQKPLVLSKENILAMLLNWGARQNREEVVFGYGFDRTVFNRGQGRIHYADMEQYYEAFHRGEREVEALFAQVLTEKDYQIAQAVWDHNETYWDEVSAMVRDLTGVTPERVERLSVKSPSGTIYSGGYYHLAFKPESNIKTFALSEKAAITALYEPQGMFAMTRTGHTKARHHGQRGSRLLRLDLGVEVEHLRDVVHDLYFRPVVRDLNRLINDEQVQNIILSTLGFEAFRQLKPWVHGLATAYRPMDNYGEKVFRKLMGNTSAAILGWSMSSALNQTLGWFTVIPALGLKRTVRGIMDFYGHPAQWKEKKDFAFGKSEYLRDRVNTFDRDVKAAIEQVTESPVRGKWSAVQESFFLAAGWMDMGVSLPAWLAGYDLGMNKFNGDEAKAVEYADWIVRSTQNTGAAKDLSSIQRGGPLWKSLTMFYTAFNSIYNQSREQWFRGHGREDLPRLAAYLVFQFVMPALLGDMLNRRGPDWDDDDPEEIWKWIFTSVLQYGSSQLIGVRDVVNAATSGFDYRMSPMADAGQSLARLMTGIGQAGSAALFGTEMPDLEQLGYRALDAAGTIWGIPSKQLQRTARGLVGLADDPDWSPVDLLLRKPRK